MFQNSREWRFESDTETGNSILKICDPPAIVVNSESISDVICIINSSHGNVDYHSKDGKDKRLIVHVEDTGFDAKIIGVLWLKIEFSSKADNALFKISDALLKTLEI